MIIISAEYIVLNYMVQDTTCFTYAENTHIKVIA